MKTCQAKDLFLFKHRKANSYGYFEQCNAKLLIGCSKDLISTPTGDLKQGFS